MASFLEKYLRNKKDYTPPGSRFAIDYDRWDRKATDKIAREVEEYRAAEQDLGNFVDTGIEAMHDTLLALYKVTPELRDSKDMKPKFKVNHAIIEEMIGMNEYQRERPLSVGDPIGAGLAASIMEPELEILFDKLKTAQEMAAQAQSEVDAISQQMEEDAASIEELLQQMEESDDEQESQNFQDQAEQIAEHLEMLRQQMEAAQEGLEDELEAQSGQIQASLRKGLTEARETTEAVDQFERGWGLQPGSIRRLDPTTRLELSKKLNTDKFKKLANMIGKMQSIAFTEQLHKVDYATEEIYELEQGADLARIVPNELLNLTDDTLVYEWLHRYVERNLIQYALHGEESTQRGAIIYLEDGSSSMSGNNEIWAKAIGGALLKLAIQQKRPFFAVNFSGVGSYVSFDFDLSKDIFTMEKQYKGRQPESFTGAEAVIEYYSTTMNGGTCFVTPLSLALDRITEEHNQTGSTKSDVVFVTDGHAGVPTSFLENLAQERDRLDFKIFGIAIGTGLSSEPLNTICDGFVVTLKSLLDPHDVAPIFREIGR